ncbi:MAG: PilZ domain-containing protein, partial [Gemmataceae bacterium]
AEAPARKPIPTMPALPADKSRPPAAPSEAKPATPAPVRPAAESTRQTVRGDAPTTVADTKPAAAQPVADHRPPASAPPARIPTPPAMPARPAPQQPAGRNDASSRPAAMPLVPDEDEPTPTLPVSALRAAATPLVPDDQLRTPPPFKQISGPAARPLIPDEPPAPVPPVSGPAARPLETDEPAVPPPPVRPPSVLPPPAPAVAEERYTPFGKLVPKNAEETIKPGPPTPQRVDNRPRGPRIEDTPPPPPRSKPPVDLDEIRWPNTPPPHLIPNRPAWKGGEPPEEGSGGEEFVTFDEPYRGPRIDFGDESRISRHGPDPESIIDLSEFESEGDSRVPRYSGIPTMPGDEPLFEDVPGDAAFGGNSADVASFGPSSEVIYGDINPSSDPSSAHLDSHLEMGDVPRFTDETANSDDEEPILAEAAEDDEDVPYAEEEVEAAFGVPQEPYAPLDTESEMVELATPPESFDNAENRRTHQRLSTDLEAVCETIGRLEMRWTARLRDVSRGGLQIVTERRFESGTILSIQVPGLGEYVPTLLVRVMRVTAEEDGLWSLGCRFARELSERDVATLCGS